MRLSEVRKGPGMKVMKVMLGLRATTGDVRLEQRDDIKSKSMH